MGESVCLLRSFSQPAEIPSRETNEVVPRRVLTESISFGRFASEALEWEKWSAFTQNRYLEEVARFTKPGSVAEKKAFFEAHYKNRASGKTTKTNVEEANVVKTSDETVCQVRKDNLVDSEVRLVVDDGMAMDAEVASVAPSVSLTDETTDVESGEVKVINVENFDTVVVPEDEALDKENVTSLSKGRRPSSSGSKTCIISSKLEPSFVIGSDLPLKKAKKEPLSTRKRSTSVSRNQNRSPPQPFHMSINCAPSGNTDKKMPQNGSRISTNAKDAGKADKKERSGPSSAHMSFNFASSARQTTKTASKDLARKSTPQETNTSNARSSVKPKEKEPTVASKSRKRPLPRTAKEDSNAPKCSTRVSVFKLPKLPPPNSRPPEDKRKNITVGTSASCRISNNVQSQPSASGENLSTRSRTRAKSFTVSSPFNFRSDERAEKRKEFFKKLEEKKQKEDSVKEQSSCSFKENQNSHLASEEHKNPQFAGLQAPMISLTSPRFRRNQTRGRENIQKSPTKVASVKTTETRNPSMEKHKRCKIHPSQTKKKTQENSSPNIL